MKLPNTTLIAKTTVLRLVEHPEITDDLGVGSGEEKVTVTLTVRLIGAYRISNRRVSVPSEKKRAYTDSITVFPLL
jgi:hypothetical protein